LEQTPPSATRLNHIPLGRLFGEPELGNRGFEASYTRYLILRGYDPASGKLAILKRALIESWAEPGFHRFWRVWNPGIGHLLYHLYIWIGGNRTRILSTMLVFAVCGMIHDGAVMLIFRRPFLAFSTSFILFGMLCLMSRSLSPVLHQERWPRTLNAVSNLGLVGASIFGAVQAQMAVFP
jgi:hypothetical protein